MVSRLAAEAPIGQLERGASSPIDHRLKHLSSPITTTRPAVEDPAPALAFPNRPRPSILSRLTPALQRRNQRLEHYRDLVRPIAWHYAHRSPETAEDLQQVGLIGLLRASELYDDALGTPFAAFARPHIRGAILHYLRDQARPVRLPRRHQELEDRLRGIRRELDVRLGRLASPTELRQALGLSEEQWQRFEAAQRLSRPASLTALEEQGLTAADPEDPLEDSSASMGVMAALATLNPLRRQVIRQVVLEGWSLRRTASLLGVSPMTVSRQLKRGLDELRSALKAQGSVLPFAC